MRKILLVTSVVFILSACSSAVKLDEVKVEDKPVTSASTVAPMAVDLPSGATTSPVAGVTSGASVRPVESVTAGSPSALSALESETKTPVARTPEPAPVVPQISEPKLVSPELQEAKVSESNITMPEAPASAPIVYFDYDSFEVRPEFQSLIEAHSKVINSKKTTRVMIEGHTDERGGREYNLALGQKRAEAVRQVLKLLGVADSQMEAVSFGKEKPAVSGSSDDAMAKNRRAIINYR